MQLTTPAKLTGARRPSTVATVTMAYCRSRLDVVSTWHAVRAVRCLQPEKSPSRGVRMDGQSARSATSRRATVPILLAGRRWLQHSIGPHSITLGVSRPSSCFAAARTRAELSVVKDGDIVCHVCGSDLLQTWNIDPACGQDRVSATR
ncbi:hypothetical protein [Micromonospora sp. NPDC005806]|uniref:hypothetical protein n=1 Tax=Micromonospora sp. NPDC005806 TaxID=3364234 RepID=UPI0036B01F18